MCIWFKPVEITGLKGGDLQMNHMFVCIISSEHSNPTLHVAHIVM